MAASQKAGGVALLLAGLFLAVGNLLVILVLADTGGARDIDRYARAVHGAGTAWHLGHALLIAAALLWTFGFFILRGALAAAGDIWFSLAGLVAIVMASVLHVFSATEGGFLIPIHADTYLTSPSDTTGRILEYSRLLSLTLAALAILLELTGMGLFAAGLLQTSSPHWLGWWGLAVPLAGLLGYAIGVFRPYWIFNPLFLPLGVAASGWLIATGITLHRGFTARHRQRLGVSDGLRRCGSTGWLA